MAKPDRKKWPNLAKAWDDYGHSIEWGGLFDMKAAGTHNFVVLAWMEDGLVNYATLSGIEDEGKIAWEMQNDGHEPIPLSKWKKARIVPECDWMDIDGWS